MASLKRIVLLALVIAAVSGLCLPAGAAMAGSRGVLRVYNATEYIDESTLADFEKAYGITVAYSEFESNEQMYSDITANPTGYDVLIPSDYMIDRLIQEGRLEKMDLQKIPNAMFVDPQYLRPDYDPNGEYAMPYMVGTLGILYNKRMVSKPVDSWSALWDSQYKGRILMWDSMRDVIGPALKMLGYSMNSHDDGELAQALERLRAQRSLVQGYLGDELRDIMIADEGALAVIYSGEAKTAIDQNPNLAYVIPKEGSNKWVDGFVIVKGTQQLEAAHLFIDFMCSPNIAIRNMTTTGYTSPVFAVWGEFCENPVMFPTAEELARCEAFLFDREATEKYNKLWSQIR